MLNFDEVRKVLIPEGYVSEIWHNGVLLWASNHIYTSSDSGFLFEPLTNGTFAITIPRCTEDGISMSISTDGVLHISTNVSNDDAVCTTEAALAESNTVLPGDGIDNSILSEETVPVYADAVSTARGISGAVMDMASGVSVQQVHEKRKTGIISVILLIQQAPTHDVSTSLVKTAAADLGGEDIALESTVGNSVDSHGATMSGVGGAGSYIGIYSTLVRYLEHTRPVEKTVALPASDPVADAAHPGCLHETDAQGAADDVTDTTHIREFHQHDMHGAVDPVADAAHPWRLHGIDTPVFAALAVNTPHYWKAHEHNVQGVTSKDIALHIEHRPDMGHVGMLNIPAARPAGVFLDPFTAAIYSNVCALVVASKVLQPLSIDSSVAPAMPDSAIGSVGNRSIGIAAHMHEHRHAGVGQHTKDRLSPVEHDTGITTIKRVTSVPSEQCVGISSFLDAETILIEHVWAEYFLASDGRYGVDINRIYDIEVAESGSLIMTNDPAL